MPIIQPTRIFDFAVIDYLFPMATSPPAVGQFGVATFAAVDAGYYWGIDRVLVEANGNAFQAGAGLYIDPSTDPANFRDFTNSGNLDVADYASPIIVPTGRQLQVIWFPVTVGVVCRARAQVRLLERRG